MGNRKRNIAIAGIGEIGEYLATRFARDGHNVTLIDESRERLSLLEETLDVSLCEGHAGDTRVLRQSGIRDVDVFVATSNRDDVNVLAALKARSLGARKVVALVRETAYFDEPTGIYRDWMNIDLVLNTRFLVAHEIDKLIRTRGALAVEDFAENRIEMIQYQVDPKGGFTERTLGALSLPSECLVVAIRRPEGLVIPRGDDVVRPGDELLLIGRTDRLSDLETALGWGRMGHAKCIVVGGGTVGHILVKGLGRTIPDVTLIEHDRARCDFLSRDLERATVVHGDGTDVALLTEEGVGNCDVFAAVSGEDERNIIAARLARDLGARRCIALVSRPDYSGVCEQLGLEVVLSPRTIVYREVTRALLPAGFMGITPVMGGEAEFVEVVTTEASRVAGKSLREASFPRGCVVCAVVDGNTVSVARGDTVLDSGKRAILFCLASVRPEVERMFRS